MYKLQSFYALQMEKSSQAYKLQLLVTRDLRSFKTS